MRQTYYQLREVQPSDVDALAAINVAVWHQDQNFAYRFRYAKDYPDDFLRYSRLRYLEYMESVKAGIYAGIVAEAPGSHGAAGTEVVAFSFWQLPGNYEEKAKKHGLKSPELYPERRDADSRRIKVFREVMKRAKKTWFDDTYGEQQLWLITLAVLPKFQRFGIGTSLLRWGIERADAEKLPLVLFTSSMGKRLYTKHGFRTIGKEPVQVTGEEEVYPLEGMLRQPRRRNDSDE